ncbi:MAG: hypothetical protein ABR562_05720 [Thermoplasmatota archaeon]
MWTQVLAPTLALLHGSASDLRGFFQELAHHTLHTRAGNVLWCDGDHGFNPYEFAELNLTRGHQADDGGERMLVKRCMTPFQWYTALSRLLPEKLAQSETSLAVVNPFDRQFSTDELADWEQEDYVRFVVPHLKAVAQRSGVPILLGVDMARWWRSHPVLAQATHEAVAVRWSVASTAGRWRLVRDDGLVVDPLLRRGVTLLDYVEEPVLAPMPLPRPPPRRERRTRIIHPGPRFD